MTNSVYKGKAKEGDKINETAKTPWGGVAANFRSLNLIEFKIAMYRFKSAGLTFEEIRRIFLWLDTSGNGRVECDEFVVGIRVSTYISHFLVLISSHRCLSLIVSFLTHIIGSIGTYSTANRGVPLP